MGYSIRWTATAVLNKLRLADSPDVSLASKVTHISAAIRHMGKLIPHFSLYLLL